MGDPALQCGACGYDATGLRGNTCPECGRPVIDHIAREAAALLMEDFRDGRITNGSLEDRWPATMDPTVRRCFKEVWCCYSDTREYRLGGKDAPDEQVRGVLSRWALFLRAGETCHDSVKPRDRMTLALGALWLIAICLPLVHLIFGAAFERLTDLDSIVLVVASLACFAALYVPPWIRYLAGRLRRLVSGDRPTAEPMFPFLSEEHRQRCIEKLRPRG